MQFGIVTPTYNSAATLSETLRSVWSQANDEIRVDHVIKDGLSADETSSIARMFSRSRILIERDKGQSDAINTGFRLVDGEILAWQNADDLYSDGAFRLVADVFRSSPDVDVVYGNYSVIDAAGGQLCAGKPPRWSLRQFRCGRFVPMQPTAFWRRRVYEAVGELDTNLRYCMDVDFFARAAAAGFRFHKIDRVLGSFRMHAGSLTAARTPRRKIAAEHLMVLDRAFHLKPWERALFWYYVLRGTVARRIRTGMW